MQPTLTADRRTVIDRVQIRRAIGRHRSGHLGLLTWALPLAASALVAALGTRDPADLPYFAHAARTLLSSRWADTFADPSLQVGPLQLLLVALGDRFGGMGALDYLIGIALTALAVLTVGRLLRGRDHRSGWQLLAGLAAVGLGLTAEAYSYGHPAQVAIPLLWVLAAIDARDGRTIRAGALLGLGAGFEVWALLGAPLLLLAPSVRLALRGATAQLAITGMLFAPFVLAGDFRMFDYSWRVEGWTLVRFLVPAGSEFPWGLRLLQGACALGAGAGLAFALRRTERAFWAVPLGIIAVRILLDPTLYSWYWLGLETLTLLAAVDLLASSRVRYPWRTAAPLASK
jgi:hypothetical protein